MNPEVDSKMVKIKVIKGFPYYRVIGNVAKEIVRGLLEESGYLVYPYGYESAVSDIKFRLREKMMENTPSVKRLRSQPDILVYDPEENDVKFVEVKFTKNKFNNNIGLNLRQIQWYKESWNDSLLIVVVPYETFFYCQFVEKLSLERFNNQYINFNLEKDFLPIKEVFNKVKEKLIEDYYAPLLRQLPNLKIEKEGEWIFLE